MTKQKSEDVREEVKKQQEEFYGEKGVGGSEQGLDTDNDAGEALKEVVGEDLDENAPLNIAEEIEEDEEERREK